MATHANGLDGVVQGWVEVGLFDIPFIDCKSIFHNHIASQTFEGIPYGKFLTRCLVFVESYT